MEITKQRIAKVLELLAETTRRIEPATAEGRAEQLTHKADAKKNQRS